LFSNIAWAFSEIGLPPDHYLKISRQVFIVGAILVLRMALGHWTEDKATAWIGALAITFIYDIRGKGVTLYTHYTFVVFALAIAFLVTTLLINRKSRALYVWFGLAAALVFNAKYNGVLYFAVLLAIALYNQTARRIMIHRGALLSLAIFTALAAPSVIWGYFNQAEVVSTFEKYKFGDADKSAFIESLDVYFASLATVGVFLVVAVGHRLRTRNLPIRLSGVSAEKLTMLGVYGLTFAIATVAVATAMYVGVVSRRWVIPGTLFIAVYGGLIGARIFPDRARSVALALIVLYWALVNIWLVLR